MFLCAVSRILVNCKCCYTGARGKVRAPPWIRARHTVTLQLLKYQGQNRAVLQHEVTPKQEHKQARP
jgi:hypothetical protein